MKTKIFKFMLPVFAMLLAVGFAFATDVKTVSQTAYYNHPTLGVQSITIGDECQVQSGIDCKFNGLQLYREMALVNKLRKPN
ncbi:DUF6520 family protein [Subsaxibacter sp. CAU 1640]|uniref:DUF6520 family protein n=1 Tax=Subsaxibacter sp. CAU 1640 TaxID=2933271 RepID=UPI002004238F|nr:DUF6520 family protein [Subsaxibacter sp. CAU 1640]MCK7591278.1 DUF6520 family protein [Subsaxibacter sp. CAU 1640]